MKGSWFYFMLFSIHSMAIKLSCSNLLLKDLSPYHKLRKLCYLQNYTHQQTQIVRKNCLNRYWLDKDRPLRNYLTQFFPWTKILVNFCPMPSIIAETIFVKFCNQRRSWLIVSNALDKSINTAPLKPLLSRGFLSFN